MEPPQRPTTDLHSSTELRRGLRHELLRIFTSVAQRIFSESDRHQWHPAPEQSEIYIADIEGAAKESSPQIRVDVQGIGEQRTTLDHMQVWRVNHSEHAILHRFVVGYHIYAQNRIETGNLADFLRMGVFRFRTDLEELGAFHLGPSEGPPAAVLEGGVYDSLFHQSVGFSAHAVLRITLTNNKDPYWNDLSLGIFVDRAQEPDVAQVPTSATSAELVRPDRIHVFFDGKVGPGYPEGFEVMIGGSWQWVFAKRHTYDFARVCLELNSAMEAPVDVRYQGGTLVEFGVRDHDDDDNPVEIANFTVTAK